MRLRHLQAQTRVPIPKRDNKCRRGDPGCLGVGDSKYHNPDPLCRLIGPKNEVEVIVNDEPVTALVDSGTQISAVSMAFVKRHNLPIWQLQQLLDFEGFGGMDIPYIGYTQIQLQIRGVKDYDKDIMVFIQKDYSEQVLVILGNSSYKRCDPVDHQGGTGKIGRCMGRRDFRQFGVGKNCPVRKNPNDKSS